MPFLRRAGLLNPELRPGRLTPVIRALEAEEIRLEAFERILDDLVASPYLEEDEVLDRHRKSYVDLEVLEVALSEVVADAESELNSRALDTAVRWGMRRLMRRFLGRLDPKLVEERLAEAFRTAGWEVGS
jgi:Glu-tRNA(Gln) amidotransferase subunit E-like FAD-binding protein